MYSIFGFYKFKKLTTLKAKKNIWIVYLQKMISEELL